MATYDADLQAVVDATSIAQDAGETDLETYLRSQLTQRDIETADDEWAPFFPLLDWPYEELRRIDATKPIMVCEWGVGEFPKLGSKADWIRDGFRIMKDPKYPNIKACVFWHERWQNEDGRYSNLRVNSTPESLEAYRQGVADPYYLGKPIFGPE